MFVRMIEYSLYLLNLSTENLKFSFQLISPLSSSVHSLAFSLNGIYLYTNTENMEIFFQSISPLGSSVHSLA